MLAFLAGVSYVMLCWSLYNASQKDPGFMRKNQALQEDQENENQSQKIQQGKDYCQICNINKPERVHHCSKCGCCVLNMDHHCVWTAQCIGLYNRKPFVLVLFYGSFTLFLGILFSLYRYKPLFGLLHDNLKTEFKFLQFVRVVATLLLYILSSLNFIGLFYFFVYHAKLIVKNQATLDDLVNPQRKNDHEYMSKKLYMRHAYNIGCYRNIEFYFGKNIFMWFIPVGLPLGDGIYWEKNKSYLKSKQNDYDDEEEEQTDNQFKGSGSSNGSTENTGLELV